MCYPRHVDLTALGWDEGFEAQFRAVAEPGAVPARVTLEHQHIYTVHTGHADLLASVAGSLRHRAGARREFPAVGDWVALKALEAGRRGIIQAVLPRRSKFSRKVAGEITAEQVVAANIDIVFLMMGLDADYNLRRIERYLTTARDGGATPVVILNKTDVCEDVDECVAEVTAVAEGAPVIAVSIKADDQIRAIEPFLAPGRTIALLGSSGVGKSTLVNRLVGHDLQRTREVRENDQKGRHTTSSRQLVILPGGALLIDTPGMRELQLWEDAESIGNTFDDIDSLAGGCRFRDCSHDTEPGCAVKAAVEAGTIDERRLASFVELRREQHALAVKQVKRADIEQKRHARTVSRVSRQFKPRS